MKYLDTQTGQEIVVWAYQTNLLRIIQRNPDRYHELIEE